MDRQTNGHWQKHYLLGRGNNIIENVIDSLYTIRYMQRIPHKSVLTAICVNSIHCIFTYYLLQKTCSASEIHIEL